MKLLAAFFLCLFYLGMSSQDFTFERITSVDGLSQNNVIPIFKDSEGYIWFGTYDGLNRYDGYEFITYRVTEGEKSLTSNLIQDITEDKNNNIWVATFDNGVCKFNKNTEEFTQYLNTPDKPDYITDNSIYNLLCDSKNNMWIATFGGVTCIVQDNDGNEEIIKIESNDKDTNSLFNDHTYKIYEDKKDRIWICSYYSLELMQFDKNGNIQNRFYHFLSGEEYWSIMDMVEVPEGFVVNHFNGILLLRFNQIDPKSSKIEHIHTHPSLVLQYDNAGNLWSGGYDGLYLFKRFPGASPPYELFKHFNEGKEKDALSNEFIRGIYIDNTGILWLGTNGGGVLKYNPKRMKFKKYNKTETPGSISHNKVWKFYEDKYNNLWIGTEGGGVNLLPFEKKSEYENGFKSYDVGPPGEQNVVYDIVDISKNNEPHLLFASAYNTLIAEFKKVNNQWKYTPIIPEITYQVMTLWKDEYGTVWLGSYQGGLGKYFPNSPEKKLIIYKTDNSPIHTNIIRSFLEDSKGRLWIGTNAGLMLMTREQKKSDSLSYTIFKNITGDPISLSNSYVVPIIETSNGEIWIGTFGGGLNKYIEGSTFTNGGFTSITMKDGLPNNTIKSIVEDDFGNLWITSNKGLTRLDPSRKSIRNFTTHDGLQDMEFIDLSGFKRHDGEILIGGVNGFNAFYPEDIVKDTSPPNLVFNKLEINNKPIKVNDPVDGDIILTASLNSIDKITLKYDQNSFRIYFSAIQFTAPEGNRFLYKLEGFDKEWINASVNARFANYTNIAPGKYIFMVKGSNSDGVWTKKNKTLLIQIKPPFWLTPWFEVSAAVFIIAAILTIIRFRVYYIKKRNEELENEVFIRTKEIKDKNRLLKSQTEALNETNTQLEERQQIIEKQSEELRAQKETLEEANATKDKFYSILAHDLKGPFNTIIGYLEFLHMRIDKFDKTQIKDKLQVALNSSNNLYRLVENLLQWSRSQRGLIPFKPKNTILNMEIEEVLTVLGSTAKAKGVALKYNIQDESTTAFIDPDMFKTILRNLISNAIKYTSKNDTILINVEKKHKFILVKVEDNGVGIPKEVIPKLFRLDNKYSTPGTNEEGGTGLGLVLCKEFIDVHKGNIAIESKEGSGTTVSFTLPIRTR